MSNMISKEKFATESLKYYLLKDISTVEMFFSDLKSFRVIKRLIKKKIKNPNFNITDKLIILNNNLIIIYQSFGDGSEILLNYYLGDEYYNFYKEHLSYLKGSKNDW